MWQRINSRGGGLLLLGRLGKSLLSWDEKEAAVSRAGKMKRPWGRDELAAGRAEKQFFLLEQKEGNEVGAAGGDKETQDQDRKGTEGIWLLRVIQREAIKPKPDL